MPRPPKQLVELLRGGKPDAFEGVLHRDLASAAICEWRLRATSKVDQGFLSQT
jgi:hypothetical protein